MQNGGQPTNARHSLSHLGRALTLLRPLRVSRYGDEYTTRETCPAVSEQPRFSQDLEIRQRNLIFRDASKRLRKSRMPYEDPYLFKSSRDGSVKVTSR